MLACFALVKSSSYDALENFAGGIYQHDISVHQENFVDPNEPDIHTQWIEGIWMHAKRKLCRQCGTSDYFNCVLLNFYD